MVCVYNMDYRGLVCVYNLDCRGRVNGLCVSTTFEAIVTFVYVCGYITVSYSSQDDTPQLEWLVARAGTTLGEPVQGGGWTRATVESGGNFVWGRGARGG